MKMKTIRRLLRETFAPDSRPKGTEPIDGGRPVCLDYKRVAAIVRIHRSDPKVLKDIKHSHDCERCGQSIEFAIAIGDPGSSQSSAPRKVWAPRVHAAFRIALVSVILGALALAWARSVEPSGTVTVKLLRLDGATDAIEASDEVETRFFGWDATKGKVQQGSIHGMGPSSLVLSLAPGDIAVEVRAKNRIFAGRGLVTKGSTSLTLLESNDFNSLSASLFGDYNLPIPPSILDRLGIVYFDDLDVSVVQGASVRVVAKCDFDSLPRQSMALPATLHVQWRGAGVRVTSGIPQASSNQFVEVMSWPNSGASIATNLSAREVPDGAIVKVSARVYVPKASRGGQIGLSHPWIDRNGGGEQEVMAAVTIDDGVIRPVTDTSQQNRFPDVQAQSGRWMSVVLIVNQSSQSYQVFVDGKALWDGGWIPLQKGDMFGTEWVMIYWSGTNFAHEVIP
jgi:hypothetical protein